VLNKLPPSRARTYDQRTMTPVLLINERYLDLSRATSKRIKVTRSFWTCCFAHLSSTSLARIHMELLYFLDEFINLDLRSSDSLSFLSDETSPYERSCAPSGDISLRMWLDWRLRSPSHQRQRVLSCYFSVQKR
jgi:hypothetical protein